MVNYTPELAVVSDQGECLRPTAVLIVVSSVGGVILAHRVPKTQQPHLYFNAYAGEALATSASLVNPLECPEVQNLHFEFPQGAADWNEEQQSGEKLLEAAVREGGEEIGLGKNELVHVASLSILPRYLVKDNHGAHFNVLGITICLKKDDAVVNLNTSLSGQKPEFDRWGIFCPSEVRKVAPPHKIKAYSSIMRLCGPLFEPLKEIADFPMAAEERVLFTHSNDLVKECFRRGWYVNEVPPIAGQHMSNLNPEYQNFRRLRHTYG